MNSHLHCAGLHMHDGILYKYILPRESLVGTRTPEVTRTVLFSRGAQPRGEMVQVRVTEGVLVPSRDSRESIYLFYIRHRLLIFFSFTATK